MQPQQPYYGPPQEPVQPNYDFIVNPQQAQKRPPRVGGSMLSRIALVGVGLVVLLIVFVVFKNLLSGGGNGAALSEVVERQQSIVHLATAADLETGISGTTKNFATTSKLVVGSQQYQLLKYMKLNKHKVTSKQLNLKVKKATDDQLASAKASSTYDATFRQILQSELTNYKSSLKLAYNQTPAGSKGRALLDSDYKSALLLETLLSAN